MRDSSYRNLKRRANNTKIAKRHRTLAGWMTYTFPGFYYLQSSADSNNIRVCRYYGSRHALSAKSYLKRRASHTFRHLSLYESKKGASYKRYYDLLWNLY